MELEQFTFNPRGGRYLAFLGRISPENGLDTAIRAARRASWPLRIAARKRLRNGNDPSVRVDWEHYHHEVKPLLERDHARFVGELDGRPKDRFLGQAAALLFPIRWLEPFGLVMIEALACGTPVIALHAGSVPEVIEHGVTGFVCDTEDELVEAIGHLGELDPARCRAEAERRFSPSRMAEQYEDVYVRLCGRTGPSHAIRNGATRASSMRTAQAF